MAMPISLSLSIPLTTQTVGRRVDKYNRMSMMCPKFRNYDVKVVLKGTFCIVSV